MKLEPITVNLYSLYYKENHGVVSLDVSEGSVRLPSLLDMRGRNWNARDCPNEKGVRYSFNHNDINWSPRNSKEEDGKNRTPHIYPKENEKKWNSYRNHSSVRPLPTQHYSAHPPNTLSFRSLTLALAQRPFHLQLSLHSLSLSLSLSVVSRVAQLLSLSFPLPSSYTCSLQLTNLTILLPSPFCVDCAIVLLRLWRSKQCFLIASATDAWIADASRPSSSFDISLRCQRGLADAICDIAAKLPQTASPSFVPLFTTLRSLTIHYETPFATAWIGFHVSLYEVFVAEKCLRIASLYLQLLHPAGNRVCLRGQNLELLPAGMDMKWLDFFLSPAVFLSFHCLRESLSPAIFRLFMEPQLQRILAGKPSETFSFPRLFSIHVSTLGIKLEGNRGNSSLAAIAVVLAGTHYNGGKLAIEWIDGFTIGSEAAGKTEIPRVRGDRAREMAGMKHVLAIPAVHLEGPSDWELTIPAVTIMIEWFDVSTILKVVEAFQQQWEDIPAEMVVHASDVSPRILRSTYDRMLALRVSRQVPAVLEELHRIELLLTKMVTAVTIQFPSSLHSHVSLHHFSLRVEDGGMAFIDGRFSYLQMTLVVFPPTLQMDATVENLVLVVNHASDPPFAVAPFPVGATPQEAIRPFFQATLRMTLPTQTRLPMQTTPTVKSLVVSVAPLRLQLATQALRALTSFVQEAVGAERKKGGGRRVVKVEFLRVNSIQVFCVSGSQQSLEWTPIPFVLRPVVMREKEGSVKSLAGTLKLRFLGELLAQVSQNVTQTSVLVADAMGCSRLPSWLRKPIQIPKKLSERHREKRRRKQIRLLLGEGASFQEHSREEGNVLVCEEKRCPGFSNPQFDSLLHLVVCWYH